MDGNVVAVLQQTIQGSRCWSRSIEDRVRGGIHGTVTVGASRTERATPEPEGLVGIGITIQAAPRQTIVLEGDPCSHCFRVLTGTVCLNKATIDGRRQLIDFLVAGDCFGLLGVRYAYSVEAIPRSTLVRASRATLAAAVREQPGMAERLIEHAAAELARAHEQMLLLGRKNALEKVASLLVDLARRLGANPT
jgi:CRP-like cAMP-binding protein